MLNVICSIFNRGEVAISFLNNREFNNTAWQIKVMDHSKIGKVASHEFFICGKMKYFDSLVMAFCS
jgi:hypothetical protein